MALDEQLTKKITGVIASELNPQTEKEMKFCRAAISALYYFITDHNLRKEWETIVYTYIDIVKKNPKLSAYQIIEKQEEQLKRKTNTSGFQV